ncbi:MAG: algE7, partial [Paucimonas sp.]|nr:algE7 [Paucimonas sp.]
MSEKKAGKKKSSASKGANPPGWKQDIVASATPEDTKKAKSTRGGKKNLKRKSPAPLALEQRFMFDAAGAATAVDALDRPQDAMKPVDPLPDTLAPVNLLLDAAAAAAANASSAAAKDIADTDAKESGGAMTAAVVTVDPIAELDKLIAEQPALAPQLEAHKEIVFVDASVADYQQIIGALKPGVGVVVLDPAQDAWQQISAALQVAGKVSGIHIVSHGFEGGIILNGQLVRDTTLDSVASTLAGWQDYLTADADILLYGCDVTAGAEGNDFITHLASLTGADVAASNNATGAADLGGDWALEDKTGKIDSETLAFGDYEHLLTVSYSTTTPTVGTAITATTTLTGGGSITWKWYRNSTASTTGATVISGATAASYTVTAADAGKYIYAIATKSSTTDQGAFLQVVNAAPAVDLNGAAAGTGNTATFTEVVGTDTGANGVFFAASGTTFSDTDSTTFASLKVSLLSSAVGAGDQLVLGGTAIDITGTTAVGEVTYNSTVFGYAIADAGGTRTITFTSKVGAGGAASAAVIASYEALVDALKYNNSSDAPSGTRTFSVVATDSGTNNAASAAATFTVTLAATNDAPVLSDTTLTINAPVSAAVPSGAVGSLVSTVTGGITDPDGVAVAEGIAITGTDESQGTWYYTTNGGTSWTAVNSTGQVSETNALLLADNASTRLYFKANTASPGTLANTLTVRAWDTTSGTAGSKVVIAATGGGTAFSSNTDTVAVSVKPSYSLQSSDTAFFDLQTGSRFDPSSDTQANSADLDLVGTDGYPLLQGAYDSINGDLYYRVRIGNPTLKGGVPVFSAVLLMGMDVTGDGKIDVYVGVDGRNNGLGVVTFAPGSGLNISPSTTSISAPASAGGSFEYKLASTYGASGDLNADGKADAYLTFKVSFASLASRVSTLMGQTITPSTTFGTVLMTMTQSNSINGDIGGIGALTNAQKAMTWTSLGLLQQVNFTVPSIDVSGTYRYVENASGLALAPTATLSDLDSVNYSGGKLTASITANLSAGDVLGLQSNGTVSFTGTTSGSVLVSGATVGSYTFASGTLTVDFTGSAITQAQVQAVMRAVAFSSTSDTPGTANRSVSFVVTDPDGNASSAKLVTVIVEAVNDAPAIAATGGTSTINRTVTTETINPLTTTAALLLRYTTPTATPTGLSISDIDAASSIVTATLSVSSGIVDVYNNTTKASTTAATVISGVSITGAGTSSVLLTGTVAAINSLLAGTTTAQLLYQAGSTLGTATVYFAVSDLGNTGTGGVNATTPQQVGTITVNSAPAVGGALTGAVTEDVGVASGNLSVSGTVTGGTIGSTITYVGNTLGTAAIGTMTRASSTWTYTVSNGNANIQALTGSGTIKETFRITVGTKNTFVTVTINGANDAPTLTVTNGATNYTENGAAVPIFTAATASLGLAANPESGQAFSQMAFTVSNVFDGDQVTIDGSTFYIDTSSSGSITASNGYTVDVSLVGTTATVTVTTPEINTTALQSLVTGLQYGSTSDNPTSASTSRVVTLTSLKDTGGTANGGLDTRTLSLARTVTITEAQDGPTMMTAPVSVYPSTAITISTDYLSAYDPDSTSLTYTITSAIANGTLKRNGVTLANGNTFTQADVAAGLITFVPNAVVNDTTVSIALTVCDGALSSTGTLTLNLLATAPTVTVNDVTVSEASPYILFTVSVNGQTSGAMSFTPTLVSGSATVGADTGSTLEWYNGTAWVATPVVVAAGSGTRTVLVRAAISNDTLAEGTENFLLSTGAFTGTNVQNQSGATALGTIADDGSSSAVFSAGSTSGTPTVGTADDDRALSVAGTTVSEASPYAVFTVTGNAGQVVTLALQSGTATVGADTGSSLEYYNGSAWVAYSGSATMPGSTMLVRVAITADTAYEGAESFSLVATNAGASAFSGSSTLSDDGTNTNVFTAGNTTATPTAGSADNDMPVASITTVVDNAGAVTGNVASGGYTDDTTPQVTGSLSAALTGNLVVAVYRDGVKVGNATVSGTNWSFTDSGVVDGSSYSYTVKVEDAVTGASRAPSAAHVITVDATAPGSAAGSLTISENASNGTAVGTVSASDASTVTYSLVDNAGGRFSIAGNQVQVANGTLLNYEAGTSHNITVRATDLAGNTRDTVMAVTVTNVDEAPTLSATGGTASYTEDGSAVSLFSAAAISTIEPGQTVTRLDFTVSNVSNGASERITVDGTTINLVAGSGITATNGLAYTVTINAGTATVSLTTGAGITSANAQTLVGGMSYLNASQAPTAGNRVVTLTRIDDSGANSGSNVNTRTLGVSSTVTVVPVDDPTVISGTASASLTETNAAQSTGGTLTATDPDSSAAFQVQSGITGSNGHGSFSVDAAGVWTYTMNSAHNEFVVGQTYTDTITVATADGSTQLLTVTITGTNDAPVAAASTFSIAEDASILSGSVTATDADTGATLSFALNSAAPAGLTFNANGSYSFNPAVSAYQSLGVGQSVVLTIPYTVTDDKGATSSANLVITVTGTNDAPVANAASFTVAEDATLVSGTVSASDVDANASLSFALNSAAPAGLVFNANGSYSFNAAASAYQSLGLGQSVVLTVPYAVTDDQGTTSTANLVITVTGTNDAPVANASSFTVAEDAAIVSGSVTASDADANASLSFALNGSTPAGLTFNTNGSYSFNPANSAYQSLGAGQSMVLTIPYTVTDDKGATSTANLVITVTGTNDAPVANAASFTVAEDAAVVNGAVTASDADGNASLSFALNSAAPAGLTFNANGTYSFDASASAYQSLGLGQSAVLSIPYTVTDDKGATSTANLVITVTGTNDAPVANAASFTVAEDAAVVTGSVTASDSDANATLSFALNGSGPAGLTFNADGSYSFNAGVSAYQSLAFGQSAVLTIPYTVTDDKGATSAANLVITVTGTNDAPVANAASVTVAEDAAVVNGSVTATDTDAGATLAFTLNGSAPAGLTFNTDGSYSFDASASAYQSLGFGQSAVLTVPYIVTDDKGATSTANLVITVTGTNDAPVANAASFTVAEDTSVVTGTVTASDADGNASLSFALNSAAPAGLVFNADGSYSFNAGASAYQSLGAGQSAVLTIPYTVTDDKGATSTANLVITVTGTNDAPVANAASFSVAEDAAVVNGAVTASDADGNATLSFALNSAAPAGLTFNVNGTYSFDASASAYQSLGLGQSAVLTIPYTVTDDKGASSTANLVITVTGTNDAPVANAASFTVAEDAAVVTGAVTASDADANATLSFALNGSAPAGLTFNADGSYSYNAGVSAYQSLALGQSAALTIPYTVTDDKGATSTANLVITVTGTNDAPVASAASVTVAEDAAVVNGSVTATDTDAGATLAFALNGSAPAGLTFNADGSYSFDASVSAYQNLAAGQSAVLTVPYTVTDDKGATSTANLVITVTGTNDAPVANAASFTVAEDASVVTGTVTASDADSNASLSFALNSAAPAGLVFNADGSYSFNAGASAYQSLGAGQSAVLTIPYTVTDDKGATSTANLVITVTGTNDAPVANAASFSVAEDATVVNGTVGASDPDANAALSFALNGTAPAGLNFNADGSYSFNASVSAYQSLGAGESAILTIPYTVTDDKGATSTANLVITVTGTNDAPVASSASFTIAEDATVVNGAVIATDADGNASLSFALNSTAPAGLIFHADGSYSFDASVSTYQSLGLGQSAVLTIPYTVTDDKGATSTANLVITVTGTNDAPVANAASFSVAEDAAVVTGSVTASDADANATLSFALNGSAPAGLTFNADGSYSFDAGVSAYQSLALGQSAALTIPYTVTDDKGATSTANLVITVTGTNDAPVANAASFTVAEDAAVVNGSVTATDADGGATLAFALNGSAPAGLTFNADGSYSFDASVSAYQSLALGQSAVLTIPYTVTDDKGATSTANLVITVTGTNDAPVANAASFTVAEDAAVVNGSVTATDADAGATLAFALNGSAPAGLTFNPNGSYSFDASASAYQSLGLGQSAVLTVPYTVTDDKGATSSANLVITVTGTNDAPVANAASFAVAEDATVVNGAVTATDPDGNASWSFALNSTAPAGLIFHVDGSYSFDASVSAYQSLGLGQSAVLTIPYTVTDDKGSTSTANLVITVTGTNDAPVANAASFTVAEDAAVVNGTVTASDADANASLSFAINGTAPAGLTFNANGS